MDPLTLAIIIVAAWRGSKGALRETRNARRAARQQRLLAAATHGTKHTDPNSFATRAGTAIGDILATPAAVAAGVRGFKRGLSYGRHHRKAMRATRLARRAAKTGMAIGLGGGKLAGAATAAAGVGARGAARGAAAGFNYGKTRAAGRRPATAEATPGEPVASGNPDPWATADVVDAVIVDEATGNEATGEATPQGNTEATARPAIGQATPGNEDNTPEATSNDWQPCPACKDHDDAVDISGCNLCLGTGQVPGAYLTSILDTPHEPSAAERAAAEPAAPADAEPTPTTGDTPMPGNSIAPAGGAALDAEGGVITYERHLAGLRALYSKAVSDYDSAEITNEYATGAVERQSALIAALELVIAGLGPGGADFGPRHEAAMLHIQELAGQQLAAAQNVQAAAAALMDLAQQTRAAIEAAARAFVADHAALAEAHANADHAARREGYQPG